MASLSIGSVFAGKYEIQRALGSGTTAVVYEAYDRFLQRSVALKILHQHMLESREPVARFMREAQSLVQIRHPVVVHVIDAGNRDGQFYMVQELIEGKELEEAIDDESLTPEDIIEIGAQLCDGLAAVHAAGIVHRDVKPHNVLITSVHEVKLTDLGVAGLVDQSQRLTAPGEFVGTPPYAAPEQFEDAGVGPRADLYSLGVVLYEAATGRQPFVGNSAAATMRRVLEHVPAPVSELSPEFSRSFFVKPHAGCRLVDYATLRACQFPR